MIKIRGHNSLACGFDLTSFCNSVEENRGALKALLNLRQALALSGNHNSANKVSEYIHWGRTGVRPDYFTAEIV